MDAAAERDVADLLCRAALHRLLAAAMSPPEPGHCAQVLEAFGRLGTAQAAQQSSEYKLHYADALQAWERAEDAALASEYARLFLGRCPCPPHETAYGDARRLAGRETELADISGFYHAFGMALSSAAPELPDHLATELEFYSLLLLKQAYARLGRDAENGAIAAAAARSFLQDHLGRWPAAFRKALAGEHGASPYRETAMLAEICVEQECRYTGAKPVFVEAGFPGRCLQEDELVCPMAQASG
jgi:TorA maturation chaperone TorD